MKKALREHVFEIDFPAPCHDIMAESCHFSVEVPVENLGIELEIEPQASAVVVCRTYLAVVVVNA